MPDRPKVGAFYRDAAGVVVEARSVCDACVVCDGEQVFGRREFAERFTVQVPAPVAEESAA